MHATMLHICEALSCRAQGLSKIQAAIDSGDLSQQLLAMTVLRLTPVTPFRFGVLVSYEARHAMTLCGSRQLTSH